MSCVPESWRVARFAAVWPLPIEPALTFRVLHVSIWTNVWAWALDPSERSLEPSLDAQPAIAKASSGDLATMCRLMFVMRNSSLAVRLGDRVLGPAVWVKGS